MARSSWPPPGSQALEAFDESAFALKSSRVVLPCDEECLFEVAAAMVFVREGRIDAIVRSDECGGEYVVPDGLAVRDCGDVVVLPGVVDAGARFGECPGFPAGSSNDCWEGFARGTRACAAGGITTTIDMASVDASFGGVRRESRARAEEPGCGCDVVRPSVPP